MKNTLSNWIKIQASLNTSMAQVRQEIIKQIIDYPNLNPEIARFLLKLNQYSTHSYYLNAFIRKNFHKLKIGRKFRQLNPYESWLQKINENTVVFEPQESPHIGCLIIQYNDKHVITDIQYKEG